MRLHLNNSNNTKYYLLLGQDIQECLHTQVRTMMINNFTLQHFIIPI